MKIRYKLLLAVCAYWVVFALLTLSAARQPGFMADFDQWTYPWRGVFIVWAILAAMLVGLYLVLWPRTAAHVSQRAKWGLLYSGVLAMLGILSFATDMPGHLYVPHYSSFLLFTIPLVAVAMVNFSRIDH